MKNSILALSLSISGNTIFSQITAEEFNRYIKTELSKGTIAGMGIAIVTNDSILLSKGYGYADIQNKIPFSNNTVINIASISKSFIGVSIMYAMENNLLDLDNNVNELLSFNVINPHSPDQFITLRHLMGHTSGIKDEDTLYKASYHYGGDSPSLLQCF